MPQDTALIPGFTGPVIEPGHDDYESARLVWNVMHDKRPALIAKCCSVADVVAALAFARANELEIAVRGGGHSLPGLSVCDDGIVIDLGLMNSIDVDPDARVASVQAGALLGMLDTAAQEHGLVVPAGVISHTGVAGLTLGGGVGRLMRRFGLTIDSLLSVELVTVDGEILRADAQHNDELFWALRGGGGNFGIVTRFEFALHELTDLVILSAFSLLPDADAVLGLAEATMSAPDTSDELLWTSFVRKAPVRPWLPVELVGTPGIMSVIEWSGELDEGRALLEEIAKQFPHAALSIDVIPYRWMQRAGDEEFGHGLRTYVKATFGSRLSSELIRVLVERGELLGSPLTQVELLSMGGAISRVPADATAFPHRDARWLLNVPASWVDEADTASEIAWVRDTFDAIAPFSSGGAYSNFMDADGATTGEVAYGSTLDRLARVKAEYDPLNLLHLNQNVRPSA